MGRFGAFLGKLQHETQIFLNSISPVNLAEIFLSLVMKVITSKFLCEFVHLQRVLGQLMESKTCACLCSPLQLCGCTPTLSLRPSRLIMLQPWTPLR